MIFATSMDCSSGFRPRNNGHGRGLRFKAEAENGGLYAWCYHLAPRKCPFYTMLFTCPAFQGNNHDCVLWKTKKNTITLKQPNA
jgi:hypothetical protein